MHKASLADFCEDFQKNMQQFEYLYFTKRAFPSAQSPLSLSTKLRVHLRKLPLILPDAAQGAARPFKA